MTETSIQEHQTKNTSENFITNIKEKLNLEPSMFVQPKFLYEIGIFGSHSAATHAVQNGEIAHLKISPYRILLRKEDVLAFLKEKYRAARVTT